MTVRITSKSGRSGQTRIGPTMLSFNKGVALVEDELSPGVLAYLNRNGYEVEDLADEGENADDGPFDPAKHNQDQVIEHLESEGVNAEEVERVLAAEAERENGPRQKVAKWVEAREAAAKEAAEKAAAEGQGGGDQE